MNNQKLSDRIKATLTIELDFAKEDQPLIGEVLQGIIESLEAVKRLCAGDPARLGEIVRRIP
ncbi:hypothetical protein [Azomonas macrocytogenes]|uniref:Uncharacterized protein n=1 Tax=Azomonas macrocytogenes TaxID=69962 RepID=A0A839TCC4_AZOMA|nr:hypothetical protein [Azomonas macrocytogenes]MBB3105253.1 hypothetical protein [Azomonas macrocytogenes]